MKGGRTNNMWTFISKYKNYSIQVEVGEVKKTVNFSDIGAHPQIFSGYGAFTTDDSDLINALRSHSLYAGDYQSITPGKEFTGTDEPPIVTFGDTQLELPPTLPSEGKIWNLVYPEDGSLYDDSMVKEGHLMYDGMLTYRDANFEYQRLATYNEAFALLPDFILLSTIPYEEPAGIGSAQNIPFGNLNHPDGISFQYFFLHSIIIWNLGMNTVSNITVSAGDTAISGLTVESGARRIFYAPSSKFLEDVRAGSGNSVFAVTRPVSSNPMQYKFLYYGFRN